MEPLTKSLIVDDWTTSLIDNISINNDDSISQQFDIYNAIDLYVSPVWYVIGIPGNLMACFVWTRRRMRLSSGCYLAALALDEAVFLVMQVFFELETKWGVKLLGLPGLCQLFPILFLTAQHLSPLLVLAFTAERYISVCYPFHRERFCSTRRAVAAIIVLALISLAINAVQGYFWTYDDQVGECSFRLEVTEGGNGSVWSVWSWVTELLIFGVVPLIILTLNVLVIHETRRISAAERLLKRSLQLTQPHQKTSSGATHHTHSQASSGPRPSATTMMLLAVSFYLIVTTLPVTVCYVLTPTFPEGNSTIPEAERFSDAVWYRHIVYNNTRTLIYEIGLSHYACNFYIYLATGRMFREELKRLVCRLCPGRVIGLSSSEITFTHN